ncbi:MAG: N-methyl-D-aspartate receptor NMDAR2C subunit [bacterium]|nr:N-methyl-D-aspartate receptor NMDAR2C subunit [bacterium]
MHEELKRCWRGLWRLIEAEGDPDKVFNELSALYSKPERKYHTLAHVSHCLYEFRGVWLWAENPDVVELAIWIHDARDTEEESATLALEIVRNAQLPDSFGQRVSQLIVASKHNTAPTDHDTRLFVDIDLAILGQSPEKFDEYEAQIREEYSWVPKRTFQAKRREILLRFLKRPRIYLTPHFYDRYELQAQRNLTRSVKNLSSK